MNDGVTVMLRRQARKSQNDGGTELVASRGWVDDEEEEEEDGWMVFLCCC